MEIAHEEFVFDIDDSNRRSIKVILKQILNPDETLWTAILESLWSDLAVKPTPELIKVWNMHQVGDYYQQSINRLREKRHTEVKSYTALFHEMVRKNRRKLHFIRCIYSTSKLKWLSMGYKVSPDSLNFWQKQEEAGFAQYIKDEERYRALLDI